MSKIDDVLNAAVSKVTTEAPKEENPSVIGENIKDANKKILKKKSAEKPQDSAETEQLELVTDQAPEIKKEEKKKWKVPVKTYGKEKELEISEDELPEYVQRGHAATEKWKEANKILSGIAEREAKLKEQEEFFEKHPDLYLEQKLGREKAMKLHEQKVLRAYEMEKMTPEQREIYDYQAKVDALKQEEQELRTKAEKREQEHMEAYAMQRLQEMTSSALKKVGIENPTPFVYRKYLDFIRPYLENAENVTEGEMDMLTKEFSKSNTEEQAKHFDSLSPEQLASTLGKKNVEKIRKYILGLNGKAEEPAKEEKKTDVTKKFKNVREYINSL